MMDEKYFNFYLLLGIFDVSYFVLCFIFGYWCGLVWFNQVYFGIIGLKCYGYVEEVDLLICKFMVYV